MASPCERPKLPDDPKQQIEPLSVDAVQALAEAVPHRNRRPRYGIDDIDRIVCVLDIDHRRDVYLP